MKKKILTLLPLLLLASCNYDNTLYNKTYSYQDGGLFYNLTYASKGETSLESDIKEAIKSDNVNWDLSGVYSSLEEGATFKQKFSETQLTSYDAMINAMKKIANDNFKVSYKDLKIVVKSEQEATATVHYKNKDVTCQVTTNGENYELGLRDKTSESKYDDFKLSVIGDVAGECRVNNGKWPCVCFQECENVLFGTTYVPSCICFGVRLNTPKGETNAIGWPVYALIKN